MSMVSMTLVSGQISGMNCHSVILFAYRKCIWYLNKLMHLNLFHKGMSGTIHLVQVHLLVLVLV